MKRARPGNITGTEQYSGDTPKRTRRRQHVDEDGNPRRMPNLAPVNKHQLAFVFGDYETKEAFDR